MRKKGEEREIGRREKKEGKSPTTQVKGSY